MTPSDVIAAFKSQILLFDGSSSHYGLIKQQPTPEALLIEHCVKRQHDNRPKQYMHYTNKVTPPIAQRFSWSVVNNQDLSNSNMPPFQGRSYSVPDIERKPFKGIHFLCRNWQCRHFILHNNMV
jgi:hypothetical protein